MGAKSLQLGMMLVAASPAAKYGLGQKGFPPQRYQALGVQIPGMQ